MKKIREGITKLLIITVLLSVAVISMPRFTYAQNQGINDIVIIKSATLSHQNPSAGEEVLLTISLRNNGENPQQVGKISVAFDKNKNIIFENEYKDVLMPGEETVKVIKFTTPSYDKKSSIIVSINSNGSVKETSLINNRLTINFVYPIVEVVKHKKEFNKTDNKYYVYFTLANEGEIGVNELKCKLSVMDEFGSISLVKASNIKLDETLLPNGEVEVKYEIEKGEMVNDEESFFFEIYPNGIDAVKTAGFVTKIKRNLLDLRTFSFDMVDNELSAVIKFGENIKLRNIEDNLNESGESYEICLIDQSGEEIKLSQSVEGNILKLTTNIDKMQSGGEYILKIPMGYITSIDEKADSEEIELIYTNYKTNEHETAVVAMSEQEEENMRAEILKTQKSLLATIPEESTPLGTRQRFSDTSRAWAITYIEKLANLKIIGGYEDGTFKPDGLVTRGEFIKMTVVALGYEICQGKEFIDTHDYWGKDYISTAYKYGIISDIEDGYFKPDEYINREDMGVIVAKSLKFKGTNGKLEAFTDEEQISDWALGYIYSVNQEGIINGYEDGSFRPRGKLTRSEASKVIYEVMSRNK